MKEIKLLLVDDEMEFRLVTTQALTRRGFSVVEAESGERALELLREELPDIVVLDLRMEGMDGIDTLIHIRKDHKNLPVLILTGHGGFDEAKIGIRLGIVDYLQKPVDVSRLAARIRKLLERGRGQPLNERTIDELMVPISAYQRVYDDQPVREVITVLRDALFPGISGKVTEEGHRTLLVFDRHERFVGCLRLNDLLEMMIPEVMRQSPYVSYFTGMFLAQCKVVGNQPVGDIIGKQNTIDPRAPLMEALCLMVSNKLINLPVVQGGELVGMLRDKDLLLEIALSIGEEDYPAR